MCSIGGFISDKPIPRQQASDLASALLFYGSERGQQSAGVYANGVVLKRAESPMEFIYSKDFSKVFFKDTALCLIHTRMPTSGGRGDMQAQPFRRGETISVHNGYFFDVRSIKDRWNLKKSSGVDSELVTSFIESYGIQKLPEFIETTDGPSAILSINRGSLYALRAGNPLSFCRIKLSNDNYITIFASTDAILSSAVKYVWLLNDAIDFKMGEVPEYRLIRLTPRKIKVISDRIEDPSWGGLQYYNYPAYGRGYDKREVVWGDEEFEYELNGEKHKYIPARKKLDQSLSAITNAEVRRKADEDSRKKA